MPELLTDTQWAKICEFLQEHPRVYVGKEEDCRRFVEASTWALRTGAQWRFVPESYGKWNSIYSRFARWADRGVWQQMHKHFVDDPDMEWVLPDSTVIRAHACAAGAPAKKGGNPNRR